MPIPRVTALAAVLLLSAAAQAQISVFPHGPTSDDEVVVRFTTIGGIQGHEVTRNGAEILVRWMHSGILTPPMYLTHDIPLGELPPGQYRVTVEHLGSQSFVVRNGDHVPLRLRPWAIPATGALVHLDRDDMESDFTLELGGRTYGAQDLVGDGAIRIAAHAPGLVDAKLTTASGTVVLPAALYFFDPFAAPDFSVFERVLFPVLFASNGANGSRWRSEAVIANPNPWAVQNRNSVENLVCITWPCGELLEAKSRKGFEGDGYPRGQALLVPRGEADDLAFSLRIRDLSRDAESFGSQVPVVREDDLFRNREIALLDVPRDPRFRTKLRIYAFPDPIYDIDYAFAYVTVGNTATQTIRLAPSCTSQPCEAQPAYGELDLPPGARGEMSDIHLTIDEGALGWAFASVTNNTTQQVTIVAPAGRGEKR
ncbi:MAG TPA: hypothetical protein VF266_03775 [Thermoanaerobaculia bacterium]